VNLIALKNFRKLVFQLTLNKSDFYVKVTKMTIQRHGLSIGIERVDNSFFLVLKATGKLTHQDYQTITPMIDSALNGVQSPRIKALIDLTEWQGWELRAAWDDFKLGLSHGSEFEKIAIFGQDEWPEMIAKIASWFISGEVKFFDSRENAMVWLEAN